VAGYTTGGLGYGMFAYVTNPPTACTPPEADFVTKNVQLGGAGAGAPIVINGNLHTNGSLWIGNVVVAGSVTYGCQIGPTSNIPEGAQQVPDTLPNPYPLTIDDFPCDNPPSGVTVIANVVGNLVVDHRYFIAGSNRVLRSGLYCATGVITVSPGVQGNVTFVADSWISPGGGCNPIPTNLTAYYADTLYFTNSNSPAAINGPGGCTGVPRAEFTGIFAAPRGGIRIGGGHNTFNGGFIMDTLLMTGQDNIINATGLLGGGSITTALVE
jgi:hypothetical protein